MALDEAKLKEQEARAQCQSLQARCERVEQAEAELEKLKNQLPSLSVVGELEDCCAEKEELQE